MGNSDLGIGMAWYRATRLSILLSFACTVMFFVLRLRFVTPLSGGVLCIASAEKLANLVSSIENVERALRSLGSSESAATMVSVPVVHSDRSGVAIHVPIEFLHRLL